MPEAPIRLRTRRVMGQEIEFGVTHAEEAQRARAGANASIQLSHFTVGAYALLEDSDRERVRWDYGDETPLRDARGFELTRAAAHPTQLTDQGQDAHVPSVDMDLPLAAHESIPRDLDDSAVLHFAQRRAIGNAVLRNGARLYVDHAHPEYSAPETMTARECLVWDRAGEEIARAAMARIDGADTVPSIALYKNNTDGKGQSYGTHENYLVDRAVPFDRLVEVLLPFFTTRQVLVGSGRVGLGTRGQEPGFQLSSRADFFESEVALETTLNRPIVNSRDEPHSDASRFRRLHVIIGDANLFETPNYLKTGMTSLVLAAAEAEQATGEAILPDIRLADPVAALHRVSHDLTLREDLECADGSAITALGIQRAYLDAVAAHADVGDAETADVIGQWRELLDILESDDRAAAADRIEWLGKHTLLESFRARHGLEWDDPRLTALDIQFTDLRPAKSLYLKLRGAGRARTLVSDDEVRRAMVEAPTSTRAYLRGALVTHHRSELDSAGWDAVTIKDDGAALRLRFSDPRFGSQAWCADNGVDPSAPVEAIIAAARAIETQPATAETPTSHNEPPTRPAGAKEEQ
ncbi:proteasome accessory factor PafA2 [Helcobacillus massiliensis]|uniref:Proteasome accessory factor A n=1 Tax=Helcobacillus massiliensis TaxID=521392 RepID=A0A839QRQ4_9MICO|nr:MULTISPECIES: depupylase/deamidase Dop [Helcobacillus]MBB3022445.1 proteasome accessory factor A [Helcobacillus massiliensis]MCG7427342.1 proteasome accessory factor PafA2 [Helcobacillus sp. ACRRO]MCT1557081.1 proteasome accessory factor PafA2 [Helcobacillus massiliensis]MCT2036184.1 proteasome accessory factor PafA2 [Helcobacillus massiliensis]MCT2331315.1 proteasome accessory factor PafA2 [Helcobacillus massiliensis]